MIVKNKVGTKSGATPASWEVLSERVALHWFWYCFFNSRSKAAKYIVKSGSILPFSSTFKMHQILPLREFLYIFVHKAAAGLIELKTLPPTEGAAYKVYTVVKHVFEPKWVWMDC